MGPGAGRVNRGLRPYDPVSGRHLPLARIEARAVPEDPETGTATVNGHAAEWFRWSATCEEGQEFTAAAWRFPDLGIELRSADGSQELEPLAQTLVLSDAISADRSTVLIVSDLGTP